MFEEVAKIYDEISRNSAMIAVNMRHAAKGKMSAEDTASDWNTRQKRIVEAILRVNDLVIGKRDKGD